MMEIRKAELSDAGAIARVHVDSWRETYAGLVPDSHLASLSYEKRQEQWEQILAQDAPLNTCNIVGMAGGKLCGFVHCGSPRDKDFQQGEFSYSGEIYSIYLMQAYQGQGIGRALFETAQQSFISQNVKSFYLWVLRDNKTRSFYRHMEGIEFVDKVIEIGGQQLTETAMGWEFA